ncbi:hypothetical protein FE784_00595 [Paenibacillus hemerocallicola]|uniref:Nuclease SbcCD subunit C n=1 Tax=Paenibacillus hemerocallicola TaxID=1172614 RepID=A0A5C4TGU3_9BACL|nr:ATP-binding protein [Paenibacillus hemerocallicola]TNJ68198.1 hypothetical protein FE784_00595 [Paenibacillus hemerocallicola]
MKKILLDRLTFRNFKGFRQFALDANGGNLDVYGDNATGKTTLFDGFTWLLFGKDSANNTNFEIKELDSSGKVRQHRLEHEVEGVLLVDGRRRTFRRVFAEKWTKKRGALRETFSGHETDYYVDEVPVSKGEYDAEVAELIPEDLFKLLTNPSYFNDDKHFDWKARRKLLLEVCGGVSDAEVLHSKPELTPLESVLKERDAEKHKDHLKSRMSRINGDIKDIPTRISEAQRAMPNVADLSEELLKEDIESLRTRIAERNAELTRIKDGGEIAVKERRLREIETEQLSIKNRLQTAALIAVASQRDVVSQLHQGIDRLRRLIDDGDHRIHRNQQSIEDLEQKRVQLRSEFTAAKAAEHVHTADDNCPSCGQILPEERRKEAQDKALAAFNRAKAEQLETIQRRGQAAKAEAERLAGENDRYRRDIDHAKAELQPLETQAAAANAELERLRAGIQDPASDPEFARFQEEAERLRVEIADLRVNGQQAAAGVERAVADLQREVSAFESDKAKFEQVRKQQARIVELEQQESKLAGEYEQLQHELYLTEEFTRAKVNLLQSRIDSKFRFARFRLFEEQVNGGLKECCETLYNGVPYDKGLNNAARINVGIDIINTLSQHYGVSAPIFVDNAEAVTQLAETAAQVIRLIVPPAFDNLPQEAQESLIALHGSIRKAQEQWTKQNKQLRIEAAGTGEDDLLVVDNEVIA